MVTPIGDVEIRRRQPIFYANRYLSCCCRSSTFMFLFIFLL